jgi:pyruvyltransferase
MAPPSKFLSPEANRPTGPVRAFWCRIPSLPNFGDALTPWLIRRVNGQYPSYVAPDDPRDKYFIAGSIMEFTCAACTVWGSGILARADPVSPESKLLAVRGPLTRNRALECGACCPEVYGDPALLLPKLYSPPPAPKRGIGLIAHFSDKPRLARSLVAIQYVKLIDIQQPVESVIDQITSCECVASSSLHGLIASHAYGVPAVWVQFRPLPNGDGVKFHDYFLSVGLGPTSPRALGYDAVDLDGVARDAVLPANSLDLDQLWNACPFRGES